MMSGIIEILEQAAVELSGGRYQPKSNHHYPCAGDYPMASMDRGAGQDHLAIFVNTLRGGGAERAMVRLANHFVTRGFRVDLLLLENTGPYRSQVSESVRVIDLATDSRRSLRSLAQVMGYLRRERPAAMIAALKQSCMVSLWAKRLTGVGTRVIPTIRGNMEPPDKRLHHRLGRRLIYRWADEIVAVSGGVADEFARLSGLPRERLTVVYNGVLAPEFVLGLAAPADHPWLEEHGTPVILAVGRLVTEKDYPTLIRAFARLRAEGPVRLIILGEGPCRGDLESLVALCGLQDDVSLPGFVEIPQAYMAKASVLVLSSLREGLPNVLIEAMASGTPVVATDCPSGPRELLVDGEYGPLVPVGDDERLAAAIRQQLLVPTPAPKLQEWAARFTVDACASELLQLAGLSAAPGGRSKWD